MGKKSHIGGIVNQKSEGTLVNFWVLIKNQNITLKIDKRSNFPSKFGENFERKRIGTHQKHVVMGGVDSSSFLTLHLPYFFLFRGKKLANS